MGGACVGGACVGGACVGGAYVDGACVCWCSTKACFRLSRVSDLQNVSPLYARVCTILFVS